jgi:MFS family permease
MRARDVSTTAGSLFAIAVAGGLVSAFPARRLTERVGEIPALLCAGAVLAIAAALFVLFGGRVPWLAWASMVCYGAGFATVVSAGLSLTVVLIPRPELAGRIMAVVIASTFASQFLASTIGAAILDPLNRWATNVGYYGLLVAAEVCFVLGAMFLVRLRAIRPPDARHS